MPPFTRLVYCRSLFRFPLTSEAHTGNTRSSVGRNGYRAVRRWPACASHSTLAGSARPADIAQCEIAEPALSPSEHAVSIAPQPGFELTPITSVTTRRRGACGSIFAAAQTFKPHFPRSAGHEGFEHTPITSTRCQNHNVFPDRWAFLASDRYLRKRSMFEPQLQWPATSG